MGKKKLNFKDISIHESAEESPGFLLWRVSTLWRRSLEKVLKPLGLTHPQFVILAVTGWLTRTSQKVSQAKIGRYAALDPNTTSQILRGLETKGWIERVHRDDERSKSPSLTQAGQEVLKQALPAVEHADAVFFSSIDLKDTHLLKTLSLLANPTC